MNTNLVNDYIQQLGTLVSNGVSLINSSKYPDYSDISDRDRAWMVTSYRAAIDRIAPNTSYSKQSEYILQKEDFDGLQACKLIGVMEALLRDLKEGWYTGFIESIHADLFSDFLERAKYLLDEGHKDAAAVVTGSTLEAHLRQLANKFGVPVTDASGKPAKASKMNGDLARVNAYSKGDQKNVTAWLDLRNNAAHGEYGKYTKEQVALMIDAIRDFITRNPA